MRLSSDKQHTANTEHDVTYSPLGQMFSIIDCQRSSLRYIILDCPTETTLDFYIQQFKSFNVTTVVRCCQPTYNVNRLRKHNIDVVDLPFKDGGVPPVQVVRDWLLLVEKCKGQEPPKEVDQPNTIAVHCVAGLGRAPVLVAISLIEVGMKPLDAIEYIRRQRRGSFNKPQIAYLDAYKRMLKQKSPKSNHSFRSSLGKMFRMRSKSPLSQSS